MRSPMKPVTLAIIAVAVAAACSTAVAAAPPTVPVLVQKVRTQTLAQTVTAYGQLVPNPQTLQWFSATLAGKVSSVAVTVGSTVKPGQVIAHIKPTPQTRAKLQSAQSQLASAKAQLKQTQALVQNGLGTLSSLATARNNVATVRSKLAALTADGVSEKGQILKAAQAGVITQIMATPGQWVNAGARVAALAPSNSLWVRLGLTPRRAARVKTGAAVRLVPVFASGKPVAAKVLRVAGQANAKTGLVDAEVALPASTRGFFAGEWVTGVIVMSHLTLPTVPRSAVLHDNQGYYLFVVRGGKAHRVNVQPRVRDNGQIGIEGLKAGATVVIQGNFELADGLAVRIESNAKTPATTS
ncbi:MAG: efflux RND transporter periplasmic adaptor subunit [Sinobacteraceae bacterium]|nr:efflux RND transporter periplasmic adaptor subunit [Nevskiaceae bacterium]